MNNSTVSIVTYCYRCKIIIALIPVNEKNQTKWENGKSKSIPYIHVVLCRNCTKLHINDKVIVGLLGDQVDKKLYRNSSADNRIRKLFTEDPIYYTIKDKFIVCNPYILLSEMKTEYIIATITKSTSNPIVKTIPPYYL